MSLPIFVYALSRMAKSDRVRKEQAAQQERENTVYNFGYQTNEGGDRIGPMVQFDESKGHDINSFDTTHIRAGTSGQLKEVSKGSGFIDFHMDVETGAPVYNLSPMSQRVANGEVIPAGKINYATGETNLLPGVANFFNNKYSSKPRGDAISSEITDTAHESVDGGRHATAQAAQEANTKAGFPNAPIPVIDTVTDTYAEGETSTKEIRRSNISSIASAAKSAAKDAPLLSFKFADGESSIDYQATTNTKREDLRTFDRMFTMALSGKDLAKGARQYFDPTTYESSVRSLASQIVNVTTEIDNKNISRPNVFLMDNPKQFLQSNYPGLALIPELPRAVEEAFGKEAYTQFAGVVDKNAMEGNETLVTVRQNADGQGTNVALATPYPPAVKDGMSGLQQVLMGQGVPQSDINIFIQENVTAYDDPDLQVASQNQPNAKVINDLFSLRVGGKTTGRTHFQVLQGSLMRGGTAYSQAEVSVQREFVKEYGNEGNELNDQVSFLKIINPKFSGTNGDSIMFRTIYGEGMGMGFKEYRQSSIIKGDALNTAEMMLSGFANTYRKEDGSLIPFGSRMGELVVGFDGVLYMYDEFAKPVIDRIIGRDKLGRTARGDEMLVEMTTALGVDNPLRKFSFDSLSPLEQQAEAQRRGMTVEQYAAAEREARANIDKAWQATLADAKAKGGNDKEVVYKLAMRGYYRFMSAYAMAAAVQGGTGGRTISDQDVQNFLVAFNTDGFFSNPENEEAVVKSVLTMVQREKAIHQKIASGGADAVAMMKLMTFPGGGHRGVTYRDVMKEIGLSTGADGDQGKDAPPPEGSLTFGDTVITPDNTSKFFEYVTKSLRRQDEYKDRTFTSEEDLRDVSPRVLSRLASGFNTAINKKGN